MPHWDVDELGKRVPAMHAMLNTKYDIPHVIIGHCEAGSDRTSEVFASYAIQFLGYTTNQAFEWCSTIAGRSPYQVSLNAFDWYCYYLSYVQGFSSLDCNDYHH
eukprot:ANDGO_01627.mRNA.1 hypothetical protein DDB_G0283851